MNARMDLLEWFGKTVSFSFFFLFTFLYAAIRTAINAEINHNLIT